MVEEMVTTRIPSDLEESSAKASRKTPGDTAEVLAGWDRRGRSS
jgi:hypothetical protein